MGANLPPILATPPRAGRRAAQLKKHKVSRLITGRRPHADDQAVQRALSDLPRAVERGIRRTVGIANELGEVYREADAFSEGELLHLAARMNSLAFGIARDQQTRRYVMVFQKGRVRP